MQCAKNHAKNFVLFDLFHLDFLIFGEYCLH